MSDWRRHARGLLLAGLLVLRIGAATPDGDDGALTPAERETVAIADAIVDHDTFTLQGVTGRHPRRPDGGYDWDDRGPRGDPEWSWFFNRHDYFFTLYRAYQGTGDRRYVDFLLDTLDDWIVRHPPPGRMTFSAAWRPLEAARRILGSWTLVYEKLRDDPAMTPERRERFLASIRAHAEHLRDHHALSGNHLITEMLALARICLVFPPSEKTPEWLDYSLGQLERNYRDQVYPDGAYKELSAHYQRVVAVNYQGLVDLLARSGRERELAHWRPLVERLWRYLWLVQKPNGDIPLTNDSDGENIRGLFPVGPSELQGSPTETVALPYAGQVVFRSGDATRPQWAFFDRGPRGTAHQHDDRLQFSLTLGDRDMLVDNGRHSYIPGPWRDYFTGPSGHNVLLLDGRGSDQGPDAIAVGAEPPVNLAMREYAEAAAGDAVFSFPGNPRAADWRRIVVNLRGDGWIVIDRLVAFGPRQLQTLWHWHPDCEVRPGQPTGLAIRHGTQTLAVSLATGAPGTWEQVSGREPPRVQGWHSDLFNQRLPATCTVLTQRIDRPTDNVWLFAPGGGENHASILSATPDEIQLRLTLKGRSRRIDLRLRSGGLIELDDR